MWYGLGILGLCRLAVLSAFALGLFAIGGQRGRHGIKHRGEREVVWVAVPGMMTLLKQF